MTITVPSIDTTFIFNFKSGSTLFRDSIVMALRLHKIDFTVQNGMVGKKIIFVRNPIDRFFSSYFWLEKVSGFKQDEKKIKNDNNINSLSSFIMNYPEFIEKVDDRHYLPQFHHILNGRKFNNYNFNTIYGLDYSIIKIEDIKNEIESVINSEYKDDIYDVNLQGIFDSFPKEVRVSFLLTYCYSKNRLDKNHHSYSEWTNLITFEEYNYVKKLFRDEMVFLGYEHDLSLRLFKKILL